jgi:formiminoglutamate deiminase
MSVWWAERAWLGDRLAEHVRIEATGGYFTAITPGARPAGAELLPGITLPGLANVHSHAFHRALRGRTHGARGSFWTWRAQMYRVADALDPDSYFALAVAVYGEMALAGITAVGEFHYLHHAQGGVRYADPNAMGAALVAAAAEAGIRITLLDTCYLAAGFGEPLSGAQIRFSDGDAESWAARQRGQGPPHARWGAAIHSVRAVPADQLATVVAAAGTAPLHVHLSEQRAENAACLAAHACTPSELLAGHGVLGAATTAIHATHLTEADIGLLGSSGTGVCLCPTTEWDLADGIAPAGPLSDAGTPLSVGSDGHAVIDLFAEARGVELGERVRTERRGRFSAAELLTAATVTGHRAIGWPDAGSIEVGAVADLVTVATDTVRLAGAVNIESVLFAATAADVREVVCGGRRVVRGGHHELLGDVPRLLSESSQFAMD